MDGSMSSNMASMTGMGTITGTATASAAAATSSSMSMGDMGMGGGNSCKISMLWNWYTIDACFLAESWHITSSGMFAGSCIGVILLVMVLEGLRRAAKEYDAFLIRSRVKATPAPMLNEGQASESDTSAKDPAVVAAPLPARQKSFRPTIFEQLIRSLLHMLQFAVAYFIMLLAMYFNGYIIICIFIGAFLGAFAFNWTSLGSSSDDREITFCCG
ncbi:Copper transport protein ctr4 [Pseudocercospora fuligena]|uniref:Copper transport protein n=1 Tax=Pseudocercospora fuligena TaxID=685502 RepID=A0A8H6RW23_9PEZI|nr:Copper transport protein ctr4 [Pseudocercospora fuligena]